MARSLREDYAGRWWHLFNRGIAKRAVFETARDVEVFLALLGSVVSLGLIEVHAYTFLTTHFHLLVRSVDGQVSKAMQIVLNGFVRWFNRTRKRDGSLFRGRFGGRAIEDWTSWETVLAYIDTNASQAGMCILPTEYEHGSARAYRHGGGPDWLSRDVVERTVSASNPAGRFDPQDYDVFLASRDPVLAAHLTERLIGNASAPAPRFTDLVRAASIRDQSWMEWKAALADGTVPGTAFLAPDAAARAAETAGRVLRRRPNLPCRSDEERDLRLAPLHDAAGLNATEIALREGLARSTVHAALQRHGPRLDANPAYDELVARVLRNAVRRTLPMPTHPFALPIRVAAGAEQPVVVWP